MSSTVRALVLGLTLLLVAVDSTHAVPQFETDIRPLLKERCFHCHGESGHRDGGLDLRLRRFMEKGGDDGTVLKPGDPEGSPLYVALRDGVMPKEGRRLKPDELERVRSWIAAGAPTRRPEPESIPEFYVTEEDRDWWSFRPVVSPAPPSPRDPDRRARTEIDRFLLAALEGQGMGFAPEADRRTLLRRLSFDLTGLPPTPAELDAFEIDASPDAYETQVDRLLASPRYGERWARHWLDVAGYADSQGGPKDAERPHAWHYRDAVIRAFNADKPWDRFVREQLAGDELLGTVHPRAVADLRAGADRDTLAATGFLRMIPDTTGEEDIPLNRHQVLADTLHVVGTAFLGLTVSCAQCHDHKYDPISHLDYHRLRALFEPALNPATWRKPAERLVSLHTEAERAESERIEAEAHCYDTERKARAGRVLDGIFEERLVKAQEALRPAIQSARSTPEDKRSAEQKALLRDHPELNIGRDEGLFEVFDGSDKLYGFKAERKRAVDLRATKPFEPFLMACTEVPGQVPVTHRLHRGDPDQPKEPVSPGEIGVLGEWSPPASPPSEGSPRPSSGRRLAYAEWLTNGRHPLVARVLVNRFWMHHFGRGLVNTPGDFGRLGESPSHPELLDWLAADFMSQGWRLKRFHRLVVCSTAYRQSADSAASRERDPENRWYGRMKPRRLEAEALRDAMLAAAGTLDVSREGGAPVPVTLHESGRVILGKEVINPGNGMTDRIEAQGSDEFRRSLYAQVLRSKPFTPLETFDFPALVPICVKRAATSSAPQPLWLLNDEAMVAVARDFAKRLLREAPGDDSAPRIRLAWLLAFGRAPAAEWENRSRDFLARETALRSPPDKPVPTAAEDALAAWCQTLLASNGFLHVD